MDKSLKRVSCDPVCGFMIESHNEKEIEKMVMDHAKNMHKMDMSAEDVRAKMQSV